MNKLKIFVLVVCMGIVMTVSNHQGVDKAYAQSEVDSDSPDTGDTTNNLGAGFFFVITIGTVIALVVLQKNNNKVKK